MAYGRLRWNSSALAAVWDFRPATVVLPTGRWPAEGFAAGGGGGLVAEELYRFDDNGAAGAFDGYFEETNLLPHPSTTTTAARNINAMRAAGLNDGENYKNDGSDGSYRSSSSSSSNSFGSRRNGGEEGAVVASLRETLRREATRFAAFRKARVCRGKAPSASLVRACRRFGFASGSAT